MNKIRVTKDVIYQGKINKDITLIHISDIHFNKYTKDKKLNDIKEEIHKNNPDYVVITGDTIDEHSVFSEKTNLKRIVKFLTDIGKFTKVILALGNHDVFVKSDYKFFKDLNDLKNIYVLDNKNYSDDYIYISGFTLPGEYYYNITRRESSKLLIEHLNRFKELTEKLPAFVPKIALIHSPLRLADKEVLTVLNEYDLLLSGHTHAGMVPRIFNKLFKPNQGIIAPNKRLFPEVARGKLEKNLLGKNITIIINGGITKLGECSAGSLSKLNFLYDIDINKIIITNKKGRYYE